MSLICFTFVKNIEYENRKKQKIDIFENVMFIEQDCCDKCNDDIEIVPSQYWYDGEYNAL